MKKYIFAAAVVAAAVVPAYAQQQGDEAQYQAQREKLARIEAEAKAYFANADTAAYGVRYRMKYLCNKERNMRFEEDRVVLVAPAVSLDMTYEAMGEKRWRTKHGGMSGDMSLAYRLTPDFYFYWPATGREVKTYRILGDEFKLSDKVCANKWNITDETRKIGNYTCRKATMHKDGRDWTAWFTTELPHRGAPRHYNGLPGVVLELTDASGEVGWYFNGLVDHEPNDTLLVKYPDSFTDVPVEKFAKVLRLFALCETNNEISRSGVMDKRQSTYPDKFRPSTGLDACEIDNPIER